LDKIQRLYLPTYHGVIIFKLDIQPKTFIYCDVSEENLIKCKEIIDNIKKENNPNINIPENIFPVLINHEKWPFKENSIDCIVNNLYLHNTDSLENILKKYNDSLIPDGCIISNMFTFNTLQELKIVMNLSEEEREGGVSPNVMNFPHITDIGNTLSRIGFNLPSMSINKFRLYFDDLSQLFEFLKLIGETNSLCNRRLYKSKDTYIAAMALYQNIYNSKREKTDLENDQFKQKITKLKFSDSDDFIYATIEICSLIAWKYHDSQQKPKERGSAEIDLKNLALESLEKNEDPTLRIGKISPINDDDYEIIEMTEKIKEKIINKLGKEIINEKIKK
jgi:NADH dehydrogenase [ubiquinone] 1 alpha subcomplex assembly factor 5